jgi:tryptophan-rich sensory protein
MYIPMHNFIQKYLLSGLVSLYVWNACPFKDSSGTLKAICYIRIYILTYIYICICIYMDIHTYIDRYVLRN